MNGDRKTHENTEAFAALAADRTLSLEEKSEFAKLILDVFDHVIFASGDWHTNMNMMKRIYSIHWHLLLNHTKSWLNIARLSKDIHSCYCEAHKLIIFFNREFTRYLWHLLVSEHWEKYRMSMIFQSDVDTVTQVVMDFHAYLMDAHQGDGGEVDEHLKMIAGFILMVNDLRDFLKAYQTQDSVGSEEGYHNFAPIWKMNRQDKYVKCWVEQLSQMNERHDYSALQTYRCHRSHCSYPGKTGKTAMAQDLYIENKNRDLSLLPPIHTVAGYQRQGSMASTCDLLMP